MIPVTIENNRKLPENTWGVPMYGLCENLPAGKLTLIGAVQYHPLPEPGQVRPVIDLRTKRSRSPSVIHGVHDEPFQ